MSASSPAPAPPVPAASVGWPTSLRLLGVVAFVAVGFAAVWQGFGAAGFGTDTHTKRVLWTCSQLIVFAVALVCARGWLLVRLPVALAFFASACVAWWTVSSSDLKSAMSLREAVAERDHYRALLATVTVDDLERHEGLRGINFLLDQYPTLAPELGANYDRWKDRMWHDLTARYNQTPPDDLKAIHALRALSKRLGEVHPDARDPLKQTDREWVQRAVGAKTAELVKIERNLVEIERTWDAFDRTAPGRKALAEAFPETRAELVSAEEAWASATVLGPVTLQVPPGSRLWVDWRDLEKALLARPAIDTSDGRFKKIRGELFALAHDQAQWDAAAHLDAKRYDRAFGVARKHAVEWSATAVILGEQKKLDDFRERYAFFAALAANATPSPEVLEVAPPPRLKPE
jgi:hypothetical protein